MLVKCYRGKIAKELLTGLQQSLKEQINTIPMWDFFLIFSCYRPQTKIIKNIIL